MVVVTSEFHVLGLPVTKYFFRKAKPYQMPSIGKRHVHREMLLYFILGAPVELLTDRQIFTLCHFSLLQALDNVPSDFDRFHQVENAAGDLAPKFLWRLLIFIELNVDFREHVDIQRSFTYYLWESGLFFFLAYLLDFSFYFELISGRLIL